MKISTGLRLRAAAKGGGAWGLSSGLAEEAGPALVVAAAGGDDWYCCGCGGYGFAGGLEDGENAFFCCVEYEVVDEGDTDADVALLLVLLWLLLEVLPLRGRETGTGTGLAFLVDPGALVRMPERLMVLVEVVVVVMGLGFVGFDDDDADSKAAGVVGLVAGFIGASETFRLLLGLLLLLGFSSKRFSRSSASSPPRLPLSLRS